MKTKAFLNLLVLFCTFLPTLAQNKPQLQSAPPPPPQQSPDDKDDVVRITTNLVQVDAVVTKNGKPVTNLTADDFEIYEDGRKQTITSFAFISNVSNATSVAPDEKNNAAVTPYVRLKPGEARRTMAFVVDDLGLSVDSMYQVRRQLRKFIAEQLQPNDLIAIIRTSGELGALQQFTNDKRVLTRAVDQLRWNICNRVGIRVFRAAHESPADSPLCGYRTYYSTIKSLRFIIDSMGYLPGRKSLVLLSDSVPRESQDEFDVERGVLRDAGIVKNDPLMMQRNLTDYTLSLRSIAEKAIRNSVVIYSVDTQGLQYTGVTAADAVGGNPQQIQNIMSMRSALMHNRREGAELIAKQTGGFQIINSNSYGFDRIVEDQSGYYLLGYRPTGETFDKRFHHLKAKVKRGGLSLRTRFGFYGITEEEANKARPTTRDLTNIALASPFAVQDIELDLTSFFADDRSLGSIVRSFVYIDAKSLTFTQENGRYQGSIELHGAVFGDNGVVVEQLARGASLSLSESDYQQALNYGLGVSIDIPVKRPGSYQVRVATRDRASSRIGTAGQFVQVPDLKNKKPAVSGIVLGSNNSDQTIASPGARRFVSNSELYYAFMIYNAANETGKLRNLVMEAKLFRDGRNVYSGPEVPIASVGLTDLTRVLASGVIKLKPEFEPGNYFLQIVVTEKDVQKATPVVQWVDFQIEKQ